MSMKRQSYSGEYKGKIALEALKELKTLAQISSETGVHSNQVRQWKQQVKDGVASLFTQGVPKSCTEENCAKSAELYEEIGRMKIEINWLKKNMKLSIEEKKELIEISGELSMRAQCRLLELPRSSWYYQAAQESPLNLELMLEIDKEYMKRPFYGSPKMLLWLKKLGYLVNHKRVERLMRLMGLKSVAPGPHTSKPGVGHVKYPYLMKDIQVIKPNQAWCTDITYIPMRHGYMYLVSVMDWYSRCVLSWELSNTMDVEFCIVALDAALEKGKPEIFNTDQGAQFTSNSFISMLQANNIKISMDGKGRAIDNIFIERLWRSLKYENIYPNKYETPSDLYYGLNEYFTWYNMERPHSSLDNNTPHAIFNLDPKK